MFIISPHIKDVSKAYQAWALEGEEKKPIKSDLFKRFQEYKAQDILNSKAEHYRKFHDRLN